MVPKKEEITKADLLELENKINDKQQTARHWQNNLIQEALNQSDEALNEITLLNQSFNIMKEDIKEIKDLVKEWFKEIKDTFVTKEEHNNTKDRLDLVYKAFYWLIWVIFTILIWFILYKNWIWIN